MKIISDFKDYYDSMRAYGEEPGCIYQRHQKIIGLESKIEELDYTYYISRSAFDERYTNCYSGFIAFCGFGYKFYALEGYGVSTKFIYSSEVFYSLIDVDKLRKSFVISIRFTPARLDNEFRFIPNNDEFIKHGTPVYAVVNKTWFDTQGKNPIKNVHNQPGVFHSAKLILNPRLTDFAFQQVIDPYQCWQHIHQFITNELNRDTEPTQVGDDRVMCITKGFDPVTSFRSGKPGDKKVRRKQNKKEKRSK